jgi:hypothetical protein
LILIFDVLTSLSAIFQLKKGCTRLAASSDEAYQLLAHDRWFSPGILASSTTKTGRHDIAEILLKVTINTINQSIRQCGIFVCKLLQVIFYVKLCKYMTAHFPGLAFAFQ